MPFGTHIFETAKMLYVPAALLDYKCTSTKRRAGKFDVYS